MQRLGQADLERVVGFSGELAALDESETESFPGHLLESFRVLVGSETASYCELDRVGQRVLATVEAAAPDAPRAGDDPEEVFWQLRDQWPSCAYEDRTGDFRPHLLSDFVSSRELHQLQIYTDYLRLIETEYEISVGLPAPLTHTKLFMFSNSRRRSDFGERERTILTLLRPHLIRRYQQLEAHRRAAAALAALETSNEPIILLGDDGRAAFVTRRAQRLLAAHRLDASDLPDLSPLRVQQLSDSVLLLDEGRPLGLTPREREILDLAADGKTNAQIAAALWISPGTVRKHLENAYSKLGVGTRTAATHLLRQHQRAQGSE